MNSLFKKAALMFTILCLLLGTSQVPALMGSAFAAENTPLAALTGNATAKAGDSLQVKLKISGVADSVYQNVYELESTISFDDERFELISVATPLDNYTWSYNQTAKDQLRLSVSADSEQDVANANNEFALITFKVKPLNQPTTAEVAVVSASIANKTGDTYHFSQTSAYQVQLQPEKPASAGVIPDGEYPIGFTILKDGTDEASMMYTYVDPESGKLTVSGGKQFVSFKLKQNAEITSFKTEVDGQLKETETVSEDTAANSRIVRFEVADLSSKLNGWVKIYWDLTEVMGYPFVYDEEYAVDLAFDISGVPVEYPTVPETPVGTPDKEYAIDLAFLKDGTDTTSSMNRYVEPSSSKVSIYGDRKFVTFTLTDSSSITGFKTEQDGVLTDAEVIGEDAAKNTRTLRFEVADLTERMNALVQVRVDMGNGQVYSAEYQVDIQLTAAENPGGGPVDPGIPGPTNPGTPSTPGTPAPAPGGGGGAPVGTEDGTYSIRFGAFYPDGVQKSRMADYLVSPATLIRENGVNRINMTVKDSSSITSLQVYHDGSYDEVSTISVDPGQNTREISFEVPDLSVPVDAKVKVEIPALNYNGDYDFIIKFYPSTIEAGAPDPYVGGSPTISLLEDGEYSVPFEVKEEDGKKISSVSDKFVSPAGLIVKNKVNTMSMTIRNSSSVTDLQVDGGQSYKDVTVASHDEKQDTRVVTFTVTDLTKPVFAKVNVSGKEYALQFVFNIGELEEGLPKPYVEAPPASEPVLKDGAYTVDFSLKAPEGVEQFFSKGAGIKVKDNKVYAQLLLNHSSSISTFEVELDGQFVSTDAVSSDPVSDTRVAGFAPRSLINPVKAKLHIAHPEVTAAAAYQLPLFLSSNNGVTAVGTEAPAAVAEAQAVEIAEAPALPADGEYEVEITFDASSITAVDETAASSSESGSDSSGTSSAAVPDASLPEVEGAAPAATAATDTDVDQKPEAAKEGMPGFDRNADKPVQAGLTETDSVVAEKRSIGQNPATADTAPLAIYALLLAGSAWMLFRHRKAIRR
ncbi:NEAT domain-containing protein [Paenibacillus enshidis]|uniref:NEAT domain-containing protein n=1 Tax=Paenibacillus enshidis TaxID=1458439 RepID=A0ABV5ANS2_9BACL